jgi:UPF0755 protein
MRKYVFLEKKKTTIFLLILLFFVSFMFVLFSCYKPEYQEAIIVIPEGATAKEVARLIKSQGIIRSSTLFLLLAKAKGLDAKLKAGSYRFDNHMSLRRILSKLERGEMITERFTIPEGYTIRDVARLLAKKGLVDEERFIQVCRQGELLNSILHVESESVEGYLFPNTYNIARGLGEEEIVRILVSQFKKEIKGDLIKAIEDSGFSLHEIVTLASIIEKEAFFSDEEPIISSVYHNRLKLGWLLEADPTVQYAIGRHKSRLTYKDLKVRSPYNTYIHKGLPPGPICSPGISAIRAAVFPKKTPYLYFVAKTDGRHIFSKTFKDHIRAKRMIRKNG